MRACIVCTAVTVLLGCADEAFIRLLEPNEPAVPGVDASLPTDADAHSGAGSGGAPSHPSLAGGGSPPAVVPIDSGAPPPDAALEEDAGDAPLSPPAASLVLRYDFSGSGDVVPDLVGDHDARLFGGTQLSPDRTYINLDGVDDYVDIPNGVVSSLRSATFVVWLSWLGGPCWQRIFDFGISDQGEDQVGDAVTSLFMTPKACGRDSFTAMAELGTAQYSVAAAEALPVGYAMQVALVVDADRGTLTLYRDTERMGEAAAAFRLDQLTDRNNWLGRSQWAQDGFFSGAIGELRIYSRVLSAEELGEVRAEGFETP